MNEIKLNKCPYCKQEVILKEIKCNDGNLYTIVHKGMNCLMWLPQLFTSKEDTIYSWNENFK